MPDTAAVLRLLQSDAAESSADAAADRYGEPDSDARANRSRPAAVASGSHGSADADAGGELIWTSNAV